MKPVQPAELSALLDGELLPERADQVRSALDENSELRCEFENLSAVHGRLTALGTAARFHPRVTLPGSEKIPTAWIIAFTAALLVLRVAMKAVPLGTGLAVQAIALAAVLWWLSSGLLRLIHDQPGSSTSPSPC